MTHTDTIAVIDPGTGVTSNLTDDYGVVRIRGSAGFGLSLMGLSIIGADTAPGTFFHALAKAAADVGEHLDALAETARIARTEHAS